VTGHAARLVETFFRREGNELAVGGHLVSRLAEEHGTPLYVYDAGILRRRLADLRAAVPSRVEVYYSAKANPNPEVIRVFVDAGAGVEIASAAELLRALAGGAAPDRILFAGPGKSPRELELAVAHGIGEIHVESFDEIERLAALGSPARVSIRVNPGEGASGGAMRMGGQPTAFGIDEERLDEAIDAIRRHATLEFRGIHMFAGTQILDADVLVGQWRHGIAVARRAASRIGGALATVDLGGGLGIPYFANETPLDLARVKELAAPLFAELDGDPLFEGTRFILEPGRFLAGPAGIYVGRVNSVKESRGKRFVILDAGMHHHLAASGNLGQVIKRDYPLVRASGSTPGDATEVTVVGPLCTPLDTLGRKAILPPLGAGDLVAVLQSGAYGLSASPVGFLSHPMPAELLVDGDRVRCIRAAGTFEQPFVPLP